MIKFSSIYVLNYDMKKKYYFFWGFLIISILLFIISCSSENIDNDLNVNGSSVYAGGYFIDGENQYASYWVNGNKVILGEGEITDITVKDGIVYATGFDENWDAVYWVDSEKTILQGNDTYSYSIFIHSQDVYVSGSFANGSCYWKNGSKFNLTTNADSEAFGIVVNENGDVITGGYYMNNHHALVPARWNGTKRVNLSKPQHGDAEIYEVKLKGNTPVFFGMAMKPNNMVGYVPTASYWHSGERTDCNNGGTWRDNIYGGEGRGGFASGNDIYVAGNIQHIGTVDSDGNPNPDEPGITPHYWKNGQIFDLPGGPVFDNYWVGGGRDIIVEDGQIIVGGWASSSSQAQVAATWVNGQLVYLEDKDIYSVINSISID